MIDAETYSSGTESHMMADDHRQRLLGYYDELPPEETPDAVQRWIEDDAPMEGVIDFVVSAQETGDKRFSEFDLAAWTVVGALWEEALEEYNQAGRLTYPVALYVASESKPYRDMAYYARSSGVKDIENDADEYDSRALKVEAIAEHNYQSMNQEESDFDQFPSYTLERLNDYWGTSQGCSLAWKFLRQFSEERPGFGLRFIEVDGQEIMQGDIGLALDQLKGAGKGRRAAYSILDNISNNAPRRRRL